MTRRDRSALRPRAVFCVIDAAYRDRAVADAVCTGRFTLAGLALRLDVPPDWRSPLLPSDEEWKIEWQKFYYGLDLAHAFCETGDARYLECFESLVESWLAQLSASEFSADVTARRIQNWIYAWTRFAGARAFTGLREGLAERMTESLDAQTRFVAANLSRERNHRTLELYALAIAALALPKLDPSGELLAMASAALEENLLRDVLADGVHREQSTHYHMTALRSFVGFRENARRFALPVTEAFEQRLVAACEFAAHVHRPDGEIPAFSDADGGSYLDLLALAAEIFARPDFAWVASSGREGAPPAVASASFPVSGYYVQRSGWGATRPFTAERQLVFDCGPLGDGGHGHYDALSFELYAGRPLLVDPGRFTYEQAEPNWRHWFKGTAAHNTVCVDGLDQTPYRRGKASGGRAEARLLLRDGAAALDVLRGEVVSPVYPARHRRRIAFVDASYWVIEDLLESERPHAYSQRFHFAPEVGTIERSDRAAFTDWQGCGVALSSWPQCEAELETGFISRRYGEKQAAPVLALTQRGTAVSFVTLLAPRSAHEPSRQLRRVEIARLADGESRGIIAIDCGHDGARDWLAWSDAQETLLIAGFALDARHAWLRFDGRGRLVAGTALGARAIRAPNGDVLWCAATPLSAAARYDAETRAFVAADPEGAR